jgi:oligopeptidase B
MFRSGALSAPAPPRARRRVRRSVRHGRVFEDAYAWLRDPRHPRLERASVRAYLEAENAYFAQAMAPHAAFVDALHAELKARQADDDASVPYAMHGHAYWWTFDAGQQYRRWHRRRLDGDAAAAHVELLLDEPALAAGRDFFQLGGFDISAGGRRIAYAVDTDGEERYGLHVRDLVDGRHWHDVVADAAGAPLWVDDAHFLYVALNAEWRPWQVRRHRVGRAAVDDEVVYQEADPAFFVDVELTQSERFVVVSSSTHTTSESRLFPVDDVLAPPRLLQARRDGIDYDVDHGGPGPGHFYIRINDTSADYRLVRADAADPSPRTWQEVVAAEPGLYVLGHVAFENALVVAERRDGCDRVRIVGPAGDVHWVAFPETPCSVHLGTNAEPSVSALRLAYTSLLTPHTVYDYDLGSRTLLTRKVQQVPSGYDPGRFRASRLMLPARDGAQVPVSLVHRDDWRPGRDPLHLVGYGAYGLGEEPAFSAARLSLLERRFAVGLVHVRGGDELGRSWYFAGRGEQRENTFNDFIDVVEGLVGRGLAQRGRIGIEGGSAGGTLIGTVLNRAPQLFGAAVAEVPFVDVLNTMCDASLPLTPIEWGEWGDPIRDAAACDRIAAWSPYDNVRAQDYPPLLVTAGLADPRVTYWEAAKWVARLRALKTDHNVLLLKTNMQAGHGGRSGRYEALRETAEVFAFLLLVLGGAEPA